MDELAKLKKELKEAEKQKEIEELKKKIKRVKHGKGVGEKVGDFFRPRGNESEKLKELMSY